MNAVGLFDTIHVATPLLCPTCGTQEFRLQTKELSDSMAQYKIGSLLTPVLPFIFAVLILTYAVRAEVTMEALRVVGEQAKIPASELHVFGGQPAALDLAVEAPLGAKVSLAAALFQVAAGIAAPLGAEIALGEPVEFDKQTRRLIRVSLPLPEVKRRSEVLVRFRAQIGGEPNKSAAGAVRLWVYPKNQIKEFAVSLDRLEKDTGATLAVFGDSKRIRAFLQQSEIPFTDAGLGFPAGLRKSALCIGESDPRVIKTLPAPGSRSVFFSPDPALLPGVYTTVTGATLTTKVTLPILDTLATNPQSQHAFIDILRQSLDASTSTPIESP